MLLLFASCSFGLFLLSFICLCNKSVLCDAVFAQIDSDDNLLQEILSDCAQFNVLLVCIIFFCIF